MNFDRLLLYLLAALILLVTGTYFARLFIRTRTKDNLVVLIANTILLIGTILSYFYPGLPIPGIGKAAKIVILVVVIASLLILLFYPEIKRRFNRKETKLTTDPDSGTPGYKVYKGTNNGFHISFEYPNSWGRVSVQKADNYNYMPLLPPDSSVVIDSVANKNKGGDYIDASDLIQSKLNSKSKQTYLKILSRNKIQVGQGEGEEVIFSYIFPGQDPRLPTVYANAGESVIFRTLDVNYKDHIYDINIIAAEDKYERAKVGFEHLISTFRFLD